MTNSILITYASRTGTTAEVAEVIGQTLSQNGVPVQVLAMEAVKDLSPYGAVVVGSAIRQSRWLPEAAAFIQTHRPALSQKPTALFTVCITLAMANSGQYRSAVSTWVAPIRAQVRPVSEAFFAGRLDFSHLPFTWDTLLLRAAVALGIFPKGDRRDWAAIRAWAEAIRPLLAA
ncbi:MAG: flavodoxin domain-containing protein [Anaerolineales bacterium]|nr:flavodoxin domain-containing protein [Anaerolineales bacterium]